MLDNGLVAASDVVANARLPEAATSAPEDLVDGVTTMLTLRNMALLDGLLDGSKTLEIRPFALAPGKWYLCFEQFVYGFVVFGQARCFQTVEEFQACFHQHWWHTPVLPYKRTFGMEVLGARRVPPFRFQRARGAIGMVKYRSVPAPPQQLDQIDLVDLDVGSSVDILTGGTSSLDTLTGGSVSTFAGQVWSVAFFRVATTMAFQIF